MNRPALLAFFLLLSSCGVFKPATPPPGVEFRGVWVATVANIDWPRDPADPWAKKQQDFRALLDFYQSLHFNTFIVQIRTAGDAFYPTQKAPWSRFLSGEEGKAPETETDPLKWMIAETHRRGMQFHAWMNPYRATVSLDTTTLAETHDYFKHPAWMVPYGNRYYYNPGLPEVRQHLVSLVQEVVNNYEVDGIHFDDYFYPYRISGEVFDDSLQYQNDSGAGQSLEEWRRSNVDSLVQQVHLALKAAKPWVQFGISPFGVWRNQDRDPAGSDTHAGQTTYDDLYADPLLWMEKGWLDYIVPQLYWSMNHPPAPHARLLAWWAGNCPGTHLYIGNAAYKVRTDKDKAWRHKNELSKQISLGRQTGPVEGNVFFSARSLPKNQDVAGLLRRKFYRYPALAPGPAKPETAPSPPPKLTGVVEAAGWYQFTLDAETPPIWEFALIYSAKDARHLKPGHPAQLIEKQYLGDRKSFTLGKGLVKKNKALALSFLDAYGRESRALILNLEQTTAYGQER